MSTQDQIADSDDESGSSDQIIVSSVNQFELATEARSMEEEARQGTEVILDKNAVPPVDTENGEYGEGEEESVVKQPSEKDNNDNIDVVRTPSPMHTAARQSEAGSALSHRFRELSKHSIENTERRSNGDTFFVMVPAPKRPWEYQPFRGDSTVEAVLEEVEGPDGKTLYKIEYADGKTEDVSVIAHLEHIDFFRSQLYNNTPDQAHCYAQAAESSFSVTYFGFSSYFPASEPRLEKIAINSKFQAVVYLVWKVFRYGPLDFLKVNRIDKWSKVLLIFSKLFTFT